MQGTKKRTKFLAKKNYVNILQKENKNIFFDIKDIEIFYVLNIEINFI